MATPDYLNITSLASCCQNHCFRGRTYYSKKLASSLVFKTLSQWEPSRGLDHEYWWQTTGRRLAVMLKEAGYSVNRQYEVLLFHYHWIVPNLGPRPHADGSLTWYAPMTFDGTPVYYCWKWNVAGGAPEVRITTDIFGQYTATPLDPVNTLAPQELLLRISRIDRTVDTTVIRGLVSAYYRHDMTKHAEDLKEGQNLPSAAVLCFEFGQEGKLGVESYLAPLNNHQKDHASRDTFEAPVRALYPKNRALDVVSEFLESNGVGKRMVPILMAPDVVPAADARIKYYFYCPCTSFDSIRDVMTLGGRTTGIDDQLHKLKLLIQVISPLPEDFPDDQEIPVVKDLSSYPPHQRKARDSLYRPGYLYYFDIAPGSDLPDIKLYCSTRTYKADDLTIGKGITSWMVAQGQGDYVENYLRVLEGVASPKRLAEYNTLHAYVSFMIKKNGDMDVTSYLMPDRDDCHDPCSFCV